MREKTWQSCRFGQEMVYKIDTALFIINLGEALVLIYLSGSNPSLLPPNRRSFVVGLQATNSYDLDIYTRVLNSSSTNYQLLSQIYPFKKRQFLLNVMTARPTKDLTRHFSSSMSKTVSVNFDCKSTGDRIMGMCENDEYRSKSNLIGFLT
jgi:hypothetical protein